MPHPKSPVREKHLDFLSPSTDPQYPSAIIATQASVFLENKEQIAMGSVKTEISRMTTISFLFFHMSIIILLPFGRGQERHINSLDSSCPRVKLLKTPFLLVILILLERLGPSH